MDVRLPDQMPDASLVSEEEPVLGTNKQTAEKAKRWLVESKAARGYTALSAPQRIRVVQAFAAFNKIVYGQAFDLVRVQGDAEVEFDDLPSVTAAVKRNDVVLIEVKATRIPRGPHFRGHFFSMSTAELLVAQSLGDQYRFAFVNVDGAECYEVSISQVYARTKAIYPTWSVRLDEQHFPPETVV